MNRIVNTFLGLTFVYLIFFSMLYPEAFRNDTWLWLAGGLVLVRLTFVLGPILRNKPFIEISDAWLAVNGTRFERGNIRSGRVLSLRIDGELGRYLEIAFTRAPALPLAWRLAKFLAPSSLPIRCVRGLPLAREPRLIVPMGHTELSDRQLHQALNPTDTNAESTHENVAESKSTMG